MEKYEVCRKIRTISALGRRTFVYSIVVGEEEIEGENVECYGIAVRICESGDETVISGMTTKHSEALFLIDRLASNFVSPVLLADVVSDWIS